MSAPTAFQKYKPLSDAIAAVFKASDIVCLTPFGEQPAGDAEAEGEQEDKKPRPRVEICVHPAASMGRLMPRTGINAASGHLRESCRMSNVSLRIITEANAESHTEFVELVEYICDTIGPAVNNTRLLENHNVQTFKLTGGTAGYRPQDGIMETELTAEMIFTTQTYAITALDS